MRRGGKTLTALLVLCPLAAATAQEIPEGQSCGGLLCDMGVIGHRSGPAPGEPVPAAAGAPKGAEARTSGVKTSDVKTSDLKTSEMKAAARRQRHLARSPERTPERSLARAPERVAAPAAPALAIAPAAPAAAAATVTAAAAQPAAPAADIFVPMTPYGSAVAGAPARVLLTPITPNY